MTAHTRNRARHDKGAREPNPVGATAAVTRRPRWLVPGLVIALIAGGLVVGGVVSLSAVLYTGLFGGMILMHTVGHGGGGHGGHGTSRDADLSPHSSGSQPAGPGSPERLEERGASESTASETGRNDRPKAHGCH